MLDKIKSSFFKKIIFSFINDKNELKIIKYNKNLQKLIGINIINYKIFSGRYIIYETKGKGKEYNCENKLLFEGEFLNGERKKGKEYSEDENIIFEGEYLNGRRWNGMGYDIEENIVYELKNGKGYVKEYNYDDILLFEGEYLNGKRNGKGEEYNFKGNLIFEGEYLDGKRWNGKGYDIYYNIVYELQKGKGYVIEYYSNGRLKFEGEYLYGKKNGKGKEYNYYNKKIIFEGEYLHGERKSGKEYNHESNKLMYVHPNLFCPYKYSPSKLKLPLS